MRTRASKLTEAGVSGGIGAQDQGINKEADQFLERVIGAPGNGAADGDIGAGPQPGEQGGQPGLEHHKEAGLIVAGQSQQSAVEFRAQAVAAQCRPGNWQQPAGAGR